MANGIYFYISCQLWSVSGGIRICLQNCSSMSRSGVMRLQAFVFFPCPSNVVNSLAIAAMGWACQAESLPVFSLARLTLSLPWLMELCRGWVRPDSLFQGSPTEARPTCQEPGSRLGDCKSSLQECFLANVKLRVKTSNICISAPRCARATQTAYLDTQQGQVSNEIQ
jgi:hypothetical protein